MKYLVKLKSDDGIRWWWVDRDGHACHHRKDAAHFDEREPATEFGKQLKGERRDLSVRVEALESLKSPRRTPRQSQPSLQK